MKEYTPIISGKTPKKHADQLLTSNSMNKAPRKERKADDSMISDSSEICIEVRDESDHSEDV